MQFLPGNVLPHPVERVRPGHDDNAASVWLQAPCHVQSFGQIESVHDANHVGRDWAARQFEGRDKRIDDRHAWEEGRAMLQKKVERKRARRNDQIDSGGGIFVLEQLAHAHPVLGVRKT